MKVAFVIPARNKEKFIERAMTCALRQTPSSFPLEVVVSDQGSEDNTFGIIKDLSSRYDGHHKLTVLQCPHLDFKGMAGLNSHLNWLHENIEADVFICSSADDYSEPSRTRRTMEEYERTNADMVLTQQYFADPILGVNAITAYPKETKSIDVRECVEQMVGGSSSQSWKQAFFRDAGPIPHLISPDVYLSTLAAFKKGLHFLAEPLHTYVKHADSNNTGLEGKMKLANGSGLLQLTELANYQIGACYLEIMKKLRDWKYPEDKLYPLIDYILIQCIAWVETRTQMSMNKIPPLSLET